MKRAALDLSKGLNLTSSDPALPFRVARLPLWPKPGVGWTSHPGHDAVLTPIDPNGEVLHSDQSGGVVVRSGNTLTVHDITRGRLASGGYFDGVYIPRTGWIGSRVSPIILGLSSVSGVNLRPLELVSGSLDEGNYVIYAFTFYKLEAGLYFTWYAVANTTIAATGKGIKIALSEEPGDDRVVRLYVQRWPPGGRTPRWPSSRSFAGVKPSSSMLPTFRKASMSTTPFHRQRGSSPPTTTGGTFIRPQSSRLSAPGRRQRQACSPR